MKLHLPAVGVLCAFLSAISVHAQTVQLPSAAHAVGQTAGSFVDPSTGNTVFRLSDRTLCPVNAIHFYSYSNQFSPQGKIVFNCSNVVTNPNLSAFPIYGPNFALLSLDALKDAAFPWHDLGPGQLQWSQVGEFLYAQKYLKVYKIDPFAKTYSLIADFTGKYPNISNIYQMSIGPGDRMAFHVSATGIAGVAAVATFDTATGKYAFLTVPVPSHWSPKGFDEATITQNPAGKLIEINANASSWAWDSTLTLATQYDDNQGHTGFFCGSNGQCFKVSPKNDTLSNGTVGQIGCPGVTPWTPQHALYDDATGKRALIWGCDMPNGTPLAAARFHFSRVLGSTSRDAFFGSGYWIARYTVGYTSTTPTSVTGKLIASSRSDPSLCNGDYWAQPRATADHTGKRVLWDTNWRWAATPTVETNGSAITSCKKDVVVAVFGASSSDVTPPTVSITSASPVTVRNLTVGFSATDNVGAVRVEIYLDSVLLGSVDPRLTQSATYNVSAFIAGTHSLQLKAFDAAGNSNTANQYVNLP